MGRFSAPGIASKTKSWSGSAFSRNHEPFQRNETDPEWDMKSLGSIRRDFAPWNDPSAKPY
ncbi:MAG: hypothetical protein E5X09_08345, partial [Mesorhizobium sp.]